MSKGTDEILNERTMIATREEAARWFATLRRGVMTHEECVAYDLWRRDPGNSATMAEFRALWSGLEAVRDQMSRNDGAGAPIPVGRTGEVARPVRTAAILSAASLVLGMMVRLDSAWWTNLDWWSR